MAKKQPKDYNKPKYDRQTEKRRDLSEMVEQPEDSRYTEQQIEDYCSDMENVHVSSRFDLEGVQIIRQLQEEMKINRPCRQYTSAQLRREGLRI